jgi:hypothetical protein
MNLDRTPAKIRNARDNLCRWLERHSLDPIGATAARFLICGLESMAMSKTPHRAILASIAEDLQVLEWAARAEHL